MFNRNHWFQSLLAPRDIARSALIFLCYYIENTPEDLIVLCILYIMFGIKKRLLLSEELTAQTDTRVEEVGKKSRWILRLHARWSLFTHSWWDGRIPERKSPTVAGAPTMAPQQPRTEHGGFLNLEHLRAERVPWETANHLPRRAKKIMIIE